MTHRGPFQPLPLCDSVLARAAGASCAEGYPRSSRWDGRPTGQLSDGFGCSRCPEECVGWRDVSQPQEPRMRAATQRCLAAAAGGSYVRGGRVGRDAGPRVHQPSCRDALHVGELMEKHSCRYNCHCFLSKAVQKVALGSCSCMHRLGFCTKAGPEAFSFLPSALSQLGESSLQPVCRSSMNHPHSPSMVLSGPGSRAGNWAGISGLQSDPRPG